MYSGGNITIALFHDVLVLAGWEVGSRQNGEERGKKGGKGQEREQG